MDSIQHRVSSSQCCTKSIKSINIFSNFLLSIGAIGALAISIIVAVNAQILPYSKGVRIFLKTLAIIMSVIHSLVILLSILILSALCCMGGYLLFLCCIRIPESN